MLGFDGGTPRPCPRCKAPGQKPRAPLPLSGLRRDPSIRACPPTSVTKRERRRSCVQVQLTLNAESVAWETRRPRGHRADSAGTTAGSLDQLGHRHHRGAQTVFIQRRQQHIDPAIQPAAPPARQAILSASPPQQPRITRPARRPGQAASLPAAGGYTRSLAAVRPAGHRPRPAAEPRGLACLNSVSLAAALSPGLGVMRAISPGDGTVSRQRSGAAAGLSFLPQSRMLKARLTMQGKARWTVMAGQGSVYRRCGRIDAPGRQLGGRCLRLADDGHGSWCVGLELACRWTRNHSAAGVAL